MYLQIPNNMNYFKMLFIFCLLNVILLLLIILILIWFLAAYHTAIPFMGFGFLDNAIMIIAVSIEWCW